MDVNIESTDDSTDSDVAETSNISTNNVFDPAITTTHSYLGDDLEELRGRTLLDNGIYVNLPILFEKSMILFPEQTLPMVEYSAHVVNMLRACIEKDRTFGVVRAGKKTDTMIGTTAEIYEYSDSDSNGFRIKARGRQRFKILRVKSSHDQILADVKILPEIILGPPFFEERLVSLDRLRMIPKTEKEARKQEYMVSRHDSAVTPWPSWVYRQYDVRRLTMKIHKCLQFVESRGSIIPEDPVELSFWLAQNLFMNNSAKISLLEDNCAISRLQYEAKVLSTLGGKSFVCSTCRRVIAKHTDIVPMNKKGLQEAYCNPAGAIYETVTLYKVNNVVLDRAPPSTVCSWFPGYAWTIASCVGCRFHIGWRFTAVNDDLKPRAFWGLTRKNLMLRYAVMTDNGTDSSIFRNREDDDIRYDLSGDPDEDDDDDDEDDDDENDAQRVVNFSLDVDI